MLIETLWLNRTIFRIKVGVHVSSSFKIRILHEEAISEIESCRKKHTRNEEMY